VVFRRQPYTHKPLKEFYDGAFRIAIETKTPIKPILFFETHGRMNYKSLFALNPGKSTALFLDEVPVNGFSLDDIQTVKQKVYVQMETILIKYKASWVAQENTNPNS
jgi:1-acyl-sn-glycerol-3-phosphate acyltransferase